MTRRKPHTVEDRTEKFNQREARRDRCEDAKIEHVDRENENATHDRLAEELTAGNETKGD